MSQEEQTPVAESTILDQAQVDSVVNDTDAPTETPTLPSEDTGDTLILGKFKTQEDLAKAYQELETKLGGEQPPTEEETTPPPQEEGEGSVEDPEYLQWKQEKAEQEMFKPIGGVELYNQAIAWAADNLSPEEIERYNNALDATDNTDALRLLAKGMIDSYTNNNKEVQEYNVLHSSEPSKPKSTQGYSTKSDMMKDINDPRYSKDPSYRQLVEAKVAATDESEWYKSLPRGG